MKSGNLNFLEHSGPLQACDGDCFTFTFYISLYIPRHTFVLIKKIQCYQSLTAQNTKEPTINWSEVNYCRCEGNSTAYLK